MRTLARIFTGAFITLAGAVGLLGFIVPWASPALEPWSVTTGSMTEYTTPTTPFGIPVGSLAIANASATPADIRSGDPIVFSTGEGAGTQVVTHVVVGVGVDAEGDPVWRTQGASNAETDEALVPAERLLGKVLYAIPYAGFIPSWPARALPTGVVALILLFIVTPGLVNAIADRQRTRQGGEQPGDDTVSLEELLATDATNSAATLADRRG